VRHPETGFSCSVRVRRSFFFCVTHCRRSPTIRSAMANKEATLAELTEKFESSNAVLLTEYRGLTVAQLKQLRRSIGDHATYAVVKNTLTKIAANRAGISALDEDLQGPSAIAFVH